MATNQLIKQDIQKLEIGSELIDLYILDATILGGTISRFVPGTITNTIVSFGGNVYVPLPVEFTGMETKNDGTPRPRMKVANVSSTFVGLVNSYQDGIGATVKRLRTFKKYLDNQPSANSSAQFPMDIFVIEQKTSHNDVYIEWELVTPLDTGNRQIPLKQVLSYCQHRYRYHDGTSLNYSYATCPYTSSTYFTENGESGTITTDKCGKKYKDCKLRYPGNVVLPFKGFPGVGTAGRAFR